MEPDFFRFDDRYGYEGKRANLFAWTVAILLLIGLALTAWLGSFYIFGQPERPDSYRILTKLLHRAFCDVNHVVFRKTITPLT